MKRRPIWRVLRWLALLVVLLIGGLLVDSWNAMGKQASGARLARMQASSNYAAGKFKNSLPMDEDMLRAMRKWLKGGENLVPTAPLPVLRRERSEFVSGPPTGLRVTWFGHSSLLIEIDGKRVLTDPVWSERASPSRFFGPTRFFAPPMPLDQLPELDAILISHDHYDHLDAPSIIALNRHSKADFVVPLGLGAHLEYWGVDAARIRELDWWQETQFGELTLVSTPARHFSGRSFTDRNSTLWSSYSLLGPKHRAFFSGDTGMFPGFAEIGRRFGPFDVTLMESGAYDESWADVHLGPEQAVEAHLALRGKVLMPVHWGTFNLAVHGWTEPAERLTIAAKAAGVPLVVPRPGGGFEPGEPPALERWWPELAWQTAAQHPVRSSGLDGLLIVPSGASGAVAPEVAPQP